MNIQQLYDYCLAKKGVTEHFPFDEDTLVFKVLGKMFALTSLKEWEIGSAAINLKCNPKKAIELRELYESVKPGYHMNKTHWNTIHLHTNELPQSLIFELIDHSYNLVVQGLPKKLRSAL